MNYLYLKALHLIFIITWFAGLFYIVRLFIYHVEAQEKPQNQKEILSHQFLLMERRLWYGITWPSALLTLSFGISMLPRFWPIIDYPWLMIKLCFVLALFIYHLYCGRIFKQLKQGNFKYSSFSLRLYNELATLLLFSIVFLAVLKNFLQTGLAIILFLALTVILFLGIWIFKRLRA